MFNDYLKLNKLFVFITSCLLIGIGIGSIIYMGLLKVQTVNQLFYQNRFTMLLPGLFFRGLILLLVLLAVCLFVAAVRTFTGNNRNLLLMHRNRDYYLRLQFVVIVVSALIIIAGFALTRIISIAYVFVIDYSMFPPLAQYQLKINPLAFLEIFCLIISLYYLVIHIIDIFVNSRYRYQRIAARNIAVLKFVLRMSVIIGSGLYLSVAANNFRLEFDNVYRNLLIHPFQLLNYNLISLFAFVIMAVVITDYICYFKKKVLI